MLYIFVAVLAVLLILNFFMLLVLRQMMGATGRQIEKDAGRLFGMYDELLEEKSQMLESLRREEEEFKLRLSMDGKGEGKGRKSAVSFAFAPDPGPVAEFQDRDFAQLYGKVKSAFLVSPEDVAAEFKQQIGKADPAEMNVREALKDLRKTLNFESLYQLSCLPKEQQRQVLDAAFGEEPVYQAWAEEYPERGAAAFSSWLDQALSEADGTLVIKTASAASGEKKKPQDGIIWQEDPSICEGVKILYKNRLYDYSV